MRNTSLRFSPILFLVFLFLLTYSCKKSQQAQTRAYPDDLFIEVNPKFLAFEKQIEAFEQQDKEEFPKGKPIVFTGSSSIRLWETLAEDMAPMNVINRGFGGSTILQCAYYADRIILPYKPKTIVLYAGENDIAYDHASDSIPVQSFRKFCALIHRRLPKTEIYFVAMKPSILRWKWWENFKLGNHHVANFTETDERLHYIDIAEDMMDENSALREDIFIEDGLHMNEKGYEIWTRIIKARLESGMQ